MNAEIAKNVPLIFYKTIFTKRVRFYTSKVNVYRKKKFQFYTYYYRIVIYLPQG